MRSSRCTTGTLMRWVFSVSAYLLLFCLSWEPSGVPDCAFWLVLLTKRLLLVQALLPQTYSTLRPGAAGV